MCNQKRNDLNDNLKESNISVTTGSGSIVGSSIGGKDISIDNYNLQVSHVNTLDEAHFINVASEIRLILQNLEKNYCTSDDHEEIVVEEAIQRIEGNISLKKRVVSAIKEGGIKSFEKAVNHPLAAFLVGAIKGWQGAK